RLLGRRQLRRLVGLLERLPLGLEPCSGFVREPLRPLTVVGLVRPAPSPLAPLRELFPCLRMVGHQALTPSATRRRTSASALACSSSRMLASRWLRSNSESRHSAKI